VQEKARFGEPYRERACEHGGEVGFGAADGEAVLPAELQQVSPFHRSKLHPPALRSPAGVARVLVLLGSPPFDQRILVAVVGGRAVVFPMDYGRSLTVAGSGKQWSFWGCPGGGGLLEKRPWLFHWQVGSRRGTARSEMNFMYFN
jgi:hypothetical protein